MATLKDRTGCKYGKLTVISRAENDKYGRARWLCRCECGNEVIVDGGHLAQGNTKSCGCEKRNRLGNIKRTHGMSKTPEYKTWLNIKNRCYNPNHNRWEHYGGRGIKVCDRWLESFDNFYADMGKRPSDKHSIDRINVNGHYEPNNCRWATPEEQMNNTSANHYVTYENETHTIAEWAKIKNMSASLISDRLLRGWDVEKVFNYQKPKRKSRRKTELEKHTHDDFKEEIQDISTLNPRAKNLLGKRFGSLVVKELLTPVIRSGQKKVRWLCQCDCGNWTDSRADMLVHGHATSCGCRKYRGEISRTHGKTNTPEHTVWTNIKAWCYNENHERYHQYGGLGIKVCDEWLNSFEKFYEDMGDKPQETAECRYNFSRHDLNGDFTKENCYWKKKMKRVK